MAGTWKWYGQGLLALTKGLIDFDTDTFKIMLVNDTYDPDTNQDTHDFRSDVTSFEVGASGTYAAGGATLAGVSVTYDGASNAVRIVWNDVSFTGATITARTAIIYKSRGGADTADELVAYCKEAANVTSTAGTFTIDLPTPAVLTLTAAA